MAGEKELIREGKFSALAKLSDMTLKEFERANRKVEVIDETIIMTNLDDNEITILPTGTQIKINFPQTCHSKQKI